MSLSDSPAHRCQDGIFNCQSAQKHAFIRFPSTSVPRWSFQLSIKTSVVVKKTWLYQIPQPIGAKMEFFNCQSAPKKMPLSDSLTHRRPKRSTQKTCVYQIPQPKKEFSNCQSVRKNMPLSDSLTHGRPRWTFNAQQKHAFIRFPKPSEAKEDFP